MEVCLKRRQVKRKRAEEWLSKAGGRMEISLEKVRSAETMDLNGLTLLLINGEPLILLNVEEDVYVPYIPAVDVKVSCPSVVVDMGAVPYIAKGADVMAPGIVKFENFKEGDVVCVKTNKYDKVVAVGLALMSSGEAESVRRGKVIKCIHYVGDRYWKSVRDILVF